MVKYVYIYKYLHIDDEAIQKNNNNSYNQQLSLHAINKQISNAVASVEWCSFVKHFSNIVYPPIPFLKAWMVVLCTCQIFPVTDAEQQLHHLPDWAATYKSTKNNLMKSNLRIQRNTTSSHLARAL